ncbi:hypothetical protein N9W17_05345 [Jannaschia sp.]|nr:hypothetical protein [Jannaschia sp.]
MQDWLSVPAAPALRDAHIDADHLILIWEDVPPSAFPLNWLAAHRSGRDAAALADMPSRAWTAGGAPARHDAQAILGFDAALHAWLRDLKETGLTLVTSLSADPKAGTTLAECIGFLRRTNLGTTFEVFSEPDPINLAYTAAALP